MVGPPPPQVLEPSAGREWPRHRPGPSPARIRGGCSGFLLPGPQKTGKRNWELGFRVSSASVRAQGSEAGHRCPCGRGPGLCSHCPSDVRVLLRRPSGLRTCGLLGSPAKVDMAAIPVRGKGLQQGLLGVSRAWGQRGVLWRQPSGSRRGPPSLGRQLAPTEDGLRWCWLGWECWGGSAAAERTGGWAQAWLRACSGRAPGRWE